jgi:hypothetical protein
MSPNRTPNGDINWGLHESRKEPWIKLRNSYEFNTIYPYFSDRIKGNINSVDKHYGLV